MIVNMILSFLQRGRPQVGFADRWKEMAEMRSLADAIRLGSRVIADRDNYKEDVKHAVLMACAFGLVLLGVIYSFAPYVVTFTVLCAMLLYTYVEFRRFRSMIKNMEMELMWASAETVVRHCEKVLETLATTATEHGVPESWVDNPVAGLRNVVACVGLSMAAFGSDTGLKLLNVANVATAECQNSIPFLRNTYESINRSTRMTDLKRGVVGWLRRPLSWVGVDIDFVLSCYPGVSAHTLALSTATAACAGVVGGWFFFSKRNAPNAKPVPLKPDAGVPLDTPVPFVRAGLGFQGDKEAKSKSKNTRVAIAKKSYTGKSGTRIWEYEDENGEEKFTALIDGTMYRGGKKDMAWLMNNEGVNDLTDEMYDALYSDGYYGDAEAAVKSAADTSSAPNTVPSVASTLRQQKKAERKKAKKDKASTNGTPESAMPNAPVPTDQIHSGLVRNKVSGEYSCALLVRNALIFPHHVNMSSDDVDKWELLKDGKSYPLSGKVLQFDSDDQLAWVKAPPGLPCTKIVRKPVESTTPGIMVTHTLSPDGSIVRHTSTGDIHKPNGLVGRHTCSSSRGHCGSALVATVNGSVALVGIHGFGDNGTGTNGYHAFTPELVKEIDNLRVPKN